MTNPPVDHDIIAVLVQAGVPIEIATEDDLLIADYMLLRANGSIPLAVAYFRAAKRPARPA